MMKSVIFVCKDREGDYIEITPAPGASTFGEAMVRTHYGDAPDDDHYIYLDRDALIRLAEAALRIARKSPIDPAVVHT
jgi:hypothetical protein